MTKWMKMLEMDGFFGKFRFEFGMNFEEGKKVSEKFPPFGCIFPQTHR